jgi:hypothetical protein
MKTYPRRVACAFCKMKVDQECFDPKKTLNRIRNKGCRVLELMSKKSVERFCVLHAAKLFRVHEVDSHELRDKSFKWIEKNQLTCMHCGEDVKASDSRSVGCNACECNVCPRTNQPRYDISGDIDESNVLYILGFSLTPLKALMILDWYSKIIMINIRNRKS